MATPDQMRPSRRSTGTDSRLTDIGLIDDDLNAFRDAIARIYNSQTSAYNLLDRIAFPSDRRPTFSSSTSQEAWHAVFNTFSNGIIAAPHRRLLSEASRQYPFNPTFLYLTEQYGVAPAGDPVPRQQVSAGAAPDTESPPSPGQQADAASAAADALSRAARSGARTEPPPACHVIVRASSEQERAEAAQVLADLGLEPQDVWATSYATSYRVSSDNAAAVRELLDPTGMSWVVVPAEANDYLIRELYVSGPDGRRFRLIDAPAQQTVADVAAGVLAHYGTSPADQRRPTVVDRVLPGGQGERLSPSSTLHDAGVRDGASLRLGFEATAGAVSPMDHQDALHRMRNQILHFAKSRPDMAVSGAPPMLPTQYEISFVQPSFGPPTEPGGDPVRVTSHRVHIQFRDNFPEIPPLVFWDSPIFHPNIFPLYDSEQARRRPARQGLVCLGALAEAYTPALSFADLCQTLIDMAAYRNYSVLEPTGEVNAEGLEEVTGNFYDRAAATWAWEHQSAIIAMGGSPAIRRSGLKKPYQNAIEAVS